MQEHLNSGCRKCNVTLHLWQGIFALAKEESTFTPPGDVVRVSKSQFAATAALGNGRVRLLFDSLLEPSMAGVRGYVSTRQFLFETDDLYIDLRLEPKREATRISLVGQILNRRKEERAAKNLPVRLNQGKVAVTDTATNQFGEFQLEFEIAANLCILIGFDEEQPIVLPLYGMHGDAPENGGHRSSSMA